MKLKTVFVNEEFFYIKEAAVRQHIGQPFDAIIEEENLSKDSDYDMKVYLINI